MPLHIFPFLGLLVFLISFISLGVYFIEILKIPKKFYEICEMYFFSYNLEIVLKILSFQEKCYDVAVLTDDK